MPEPILALSWLAVILGFLLLWLVRPRLQMAYAPDLVGQAVEARPLQSGQVIKGMIVGVVPHQNGQIMLLIQALDGRVLEAPLLGARLRRIHTTSARGEN